MGSRSGWRAAKARAACALLLPALAGGLCGCLFETRVSDAASSHALAYRLEAPAGAGCRVSVRIDAWPKGEAKLFQAPVYYADNPICPVPGLKAADLDVRDAAGRALTARDSLSGNPADGHLILLPKGARSFSYAVDLAPADPARFGLPSPGIAPGVDAVDGAYFFVVPVLAEGVAERWRAPARISLDIVSPGRALAGSDAHRDLATPYELMFFRAAFDPARALTRAARGHELTVYMTSDSGMDPEATADLIAACLGQVEDSLLPLPTHRYFAGQYPAFWGIEGIQGYWFKAEAGPLAGVHTHEIIHTFVGIYHGDLDDPWWKEGVTAYLGQLLPVQAGRLGDSAFAAEMLAPHDTVPAVRDVALASPLVRTRLFLPLDSAWQFPADPQGYPTLVYSKGGQAAMILDRWLLDHSGGRNSIFDLVRALVRDHGPAFTRAQLAAAVGGLSGVPSEAFLAALLDRPGAFPADSLRATYLALRARGRFGPGGGKAPIAGLDIPAAKRAPAVAGASTVTPELPRGTKL